MNTACVLAHIHVYMCAHAHGCFRNKQLQNHHTLCAQLAVLAVSTPSDHAELRALLSYAMHVPGLPRCVVQPRFGPRSPGSTRGPLQKRFTSVAMTTDCAAKQERQEANQSSKPVNP